MTVYDEKEARRTAIIFAVSQAIVGSAAPISISIGGLAGYYLLDADDYDHAVRLCEGHPNLEFGSIEIRQVDFMGGPED